MTKKSIRTIILSLAALVVIVFIGQADMTQEAPEDGDFNSNGRIDSDDLFDFAYYFGMEKGKQDYESEGFRADFDSSGRVDEMDLFHFSSHWHK